MKCFDKLKWPISVRWPPRRRAGWPAKSKTSSCVGRSSTRGRLPVQPTTASCSIWTTRRCRKDRARTWTRKGRSSMTGKRSATTTRTTARVSLYARGSSTPNKGGVDQLRDVLFLSCIYFWVAVATSTQLRVGSQHLFWSDRNDVVRRFKDTIITLKLMNVPVLWPVGSEPFYTK